MPADSRYDLPRYNFARDLAYGHQGEDLVRGFMEAISGGDIEVKTDRYRNGRMVIETEQNPRRSGWKPSGLSVTQAKWWVYVFTLDGSFVIVGVDRLRRYIESHPQRFTPTRIRNFAAASENPARGWLLEPTEVIDMLVNPQYDADSKE